MHLCPCFQVGPVKYLSVTIFKDCSPEMLRDFYMDNDYRKQWDKMLIEHEQLHVDKNNGVEVGRTIKKFPLLTPREYVLAWRLWEGKDKTLYCFVKVPLQARRGQHRVRRDLKIYRSQTRQLFQSHAPPSSFYTSNGLSLFLCD